MRWGAASAPLLGPRSALHAYARGHGSCRVRTNVRAFSASSSSLPSLPSVPVVRAARNARTYVRTYVGTSVRNGLAVLTSYAKCANNARCDTCAKCAKCNHCESRAIRARCANCVCCARYACCRWQVCQPPKRARTYIRTTIVPIVPIVLFCTRASLPVRILTYVRTYTRGNLDTHARTTRGNLNTYARTTAEAIETSTHV